MAKQVLVTGASGFVGSHLAEALEMRGHSVFAMTRHPDTYTGAGKPIFGDVTNPPVSSQHSLTLMLPITWCTRWHGRTSWRRMRRLRGHSEWQPPTLVLSG
jgi:NAD dependent epimerase/dehydratase family